MRVKFVYIVCLSFCSSYHLIIAIVLQQLLSCSSCHFITIIVLHLLLSINLKQKSTTTCKPLVVSTYNLQHLQIFYGCYLSSATMFPSLQTSNLMFTSLLLLSNGNYRPMAKGIFYFKDKNKERITYYSCKRNKKILHKT